MHWITTQRESGGYGPATFDQRNAPIAVTSKLRCVYIFRYAQMRNTRAGALYALRGCHAPTQS